MPPPGSAGRWPASLIDPPAHSGWHCRGYLPHFDAAGCWQVVTYRLADSLPREVLRRLDAELATVPANDAITERRRRLDAMLDRGIGSCLLRNPVAAQAIVENWRHFDGSRYQLCAWVVMPNHVHVLIKVLPGIPLERIVQSWKSFTAKHIIKAIGCSGPVWQPDYWDRFIRDEDHYFRTMHYIAMNPVRAGLVKTADEWKWSGCARGNG